MSACHRCGAEIRLERVGVRDVCDRCRAYLHCCRNCEFYEPGLHNDCREPNTEIVADREAGNFCDAFRLLAAPRTSVARPGKARAELEKLFRKG
jgi:hypothetical protein